MVFIQKKYISISNYDCQQQVFCLGVVETYDLKEKYPTEVCIDNDCFFYHGEIKYFYNKYLFYNEFFLDRELALIANDINMIAKNFFDEFDQNLFLDSKMIHLALMAYHQFNYNEKRLATLTILFLYLHDDVRDDKNSPLKDNSALVYQLNNDIILPILNGRSSQLNDDFFQKIDNPSKCFSQLRFLVEIANELAFQLRKYAPNPLIYSEFMRFIELYFDVNVDEASCAQSISSFQEYQCKRIKNSAVAICLLLGAMFLSKQSSDPIDTQYLLDPFQSLRNSMDQLDSFVPTSIIDHVILHISYVNCVYSFFREKNNDEMINLVMVCKEESQSYSESLMLSLKKIDDCFRNINEDNAFSGPNWEPWRDFLYSWCDANGIFCQDAPRFSESYTY